MLIVEQETRANRRQYHHSENAYGLRLMDSVQIDVNFSLEALRE